MATRVRDWATVDYYEVLGVDAGASGDEIARAFRAAAKVSHPDATGDPVAAERFKDLAAAYTVLSDRRIRRDYDQVRTATLEPRPARPHGSRRAPAAGLRAARPAVALDAQAGVDRGHRGRARHRARRFAVAALTWHLHDHDATQTGPRSCR